MMEKKGGDSVTIIGIIPGYPKHTKNNVFSGIKMPPTGILSVLTNLDPGYEAYCIDENNYKGPLDFTGMPDHEFLDKIKPADFVFLYGGMSNSIPRMYSIAQFYKKLGCTVVAGGSHVDALPKEALGRGVDIVVHGEGEETAKEILEAIRSNKSLSKIPGISYLENGDYIFTGTREPIKDLDSLKAPDLTLVRYMKKRFSAIPISRGRGCNFKCEFCVVNKQYGNFKLRSPKKIVEDIVKYSDLGYKEFFFTDDNFAQDIDDTIKLCGMISDLKRKFNKTIRITVQVRTEVADNSVLIRAMRSAGVTNLCIGYESPIDEELKAMRKGVTAQLLEKRSRILAENFYIHGMFIFGYPSSKTPDMPLRKKAKRYNQFIKKAKIDSFQIFKAIPLPGTDLRRRLEMENRIFPLEMVNWDRYDGLWLCYDPKPEGIDPYKLQTLPNLIMKRRYLGSFLSSRINYGNWMNWIWNATLGFPLEFTVFYIKAFLRNLSNNSRKRDSCFGSQAKYSTKGLVYDSMLRAWSGIKRRWRNLGLKTYAGILARRWHKGYSKSDYKSRLEGF